jgi:hypothetical protein
VSYAFPPITQSGLYPINLDRNSPSAIIGINRDFFITVSKFLDFHFLYLKRDIVAVIVPVIVWC